MKKLKRILIILLASGVLFGAYQKDNIAKLIVNAANKDTTDKVTALNNKVNSNIPKNKSSKAQTNTSLDQSNAPAQNTAQAPVSVQTNSASNTEAVKQAQAQKPVQTQENKPSQGIAPTIKPTTTAVSSTQSNKDVNVNNNVQQVVVPVNAQQASSPNNNPSVAKEVQVVTSYACVANNYNEYYNEVKTAMENFNDSITIKIVNYNKDTYNLSVIDKILDDYYDIDYGINGASGTVYTMGNITVLEIQFKYSVSKSEMTAMRDASKVKANAIISSIITPGMGDLDKELAIHNYIVNNAAYDYTNYVNGTLPEQSFTDYGVLVTGKAVCEGYAKAMFRLMSLAGVECKVVKGTGDGQAHAWNIVKINGSYCQVDATWDDPVTTTGQNILSYNYFDLSDAQMAKDHQWDTSKYPSCTTTQYNRK